MYALKHEYDVQPRSQGFSVRMRGDTRKPNLVPRACDPWEGNEGSGIIRYRKPRILAKIELRIPFQWPIRFLPETDYPRAFVSFPRIAGTGNEIGGSPGLGRSRDDKKWQYLTATRQGVARYSLMKYTSLRETNK